MVVAVDDGTFQLPADQVELVAELGHLISAVLIAGDDFVDGVQHHSQIPLFGRPADQPRGKLVHRHRGTAQVPHVDAAHVIGRIPQGIVHILETVQTGCPVQLQVDVQHLALGAVEPTQPGLALGNADAQLDQGKTFARLAGTGQQQLVAFAQYILDQRVGQRRQRAPDIGHALGIRQVIGAGLHPIAPLLPAGFAEIRCQQILFFALAHNARHSGQAAGVAVLLVQRQAVFLADGVQVVDSFAVLGIIGRTHPHDGMQAFAAAVDQRRAG